MSDGWVRRSRAVSSSRGFEFSPRQSPYSTKLPQLAPVQVAQAGQQSQLELRVGVVDHHPVNLDLLGGGARHFAEETWCEDPLALHEKLFHLLVLAHDRVHINGHGILRV